MIVFTWSYYSNSLHEMYGMNLVETHCNHSSEGEVDYGTIGGLHLNNFSFNLTNIIIIFQTCKITVIVAWLVTLL